MPRFTKKPVEVEAVQFTGDNWAEMHEFTGHRNVETEEQPHLVDAFNPIGTYLLAKHYDEAAELYVAANKSVLPIVVGEWVIKDSLGFYPCNEKVFADTYELVEQSDA